METNGGEPSDKTGSVTLRSKSDSVLVDLLVERLSKPGIDVEAVLEEAKASIEAPAVPADPDDGNPRI